MHLQCSLFNRIIIYYTVFSNINYYIINSFYLGINVINILYDKLLLF